MLFVIAAGVILLEVHKHLEESQSGLGFRLLLGVFGRIWRIFQFFSTASSFSPLLSIIKMLFGILQFTVFISTSERKAGQDSQCTFYNVEMNLSWCWRGLPKASS